MRKPLAVMAAFASRRSSAGQHTPRPDSPEVRDTCHDLLSDLPERHREHLFASLSRMRRADDLWQLRSAMYTAIALTHGETEAQRRIAEFDTRIGA